MLAHARTHTHTHAKRCAVFTVGDARKTLQEKLQSDSGNAKSCIRQSALKSNLTH